jgi:glycosyltransferase involved in cell wall biosynthesis
MRLQARSAALEWVGSSAHRAAAAVRRLVHATAGSDPSNIAVVCLGFLRYGHSQAIGLSESGLNVTLYYVDRNAEFAASRVDRELFLERARAAGVEVVRVPRFRIRATVRDTLWLHRDLRRRKIAAAVVQSHIDPRYATIGLALPVALMLHDPQAHSGDTLASFPLPVRIVSRLGELASSCLILHSARLFAQLRPILRKVPRGVVPHGADMAAAPAAAPQARRLLVFGRLFEYKGVDTALDAFRALPKELRDVELIVAGRGPLAGLARDQPNVDLREEYIAESDVETLLGECRLVLLPYKDATQSGVGLQAVARGVPCVVSSTGGLPDLVPDEHSSLVVPPNDPQRLAGAIVDNIDHGTELRQATYDHANASFAWIVVARRLVDELRRLGLTVSPSPTPSSGTSGDGVRREACGVNR